MTPQAALIDIGNVLLSFDFESALKRLVPEDAPDPMQRIESLLERKDEYETGRIPEDEFIEWASGKLGFTGSADTFRDIWRSIFEPIPVMWKTMERLKQQGLRLYLFSNINSIHGPYVLESYPVVKHFDGRVFSYEVGAIKPDPAIYNIALEQHGLDASTTLYIDDLPQNITTGRSLGLPSHQYDLHRHEDLERWLEELLPHGD